MLPFEREVVGSLMSPALEPAERAAVLDYVDGALRAMPEHLRAGVVAESILFDATVRVGRALGRGGSLAEQVDRWQHSPVDVIRQWVRLLHSLVLFAEHELAPGHAGVGAAP
jgi:hypothetical protein